MSSIAARRTVRWVSSGSRLGCRVSCGSDAGSGTAIDRTRRRVSRCCGPSRSSAFCGTCSWTCRPPYGTRPLSPFTWTWFAVDWMPIVDVYLLGHSRRRTMVRAKPDGRSRPHDPPSPQRDHRATLMAVQLRRACDVAPRGRRARPAALLEARLPELVRTSVRPSWAVDCWPRFPIHVPARRGRVTMPRRTGRVPDFLSPFRWRVVAQLSNGYEIRDVDLLSGRGHLDRRGYGQPYAVGARTQPVDAGGGDGRDRPDRAHLPRLLAISGGSLDRRRGRNRDGALERPAVHVKARWTTRVSFARGLFGATVVIGPDGQIREDRLGP